jgi:hypothetical protein
VRYIDLIPIPGFIPVLGPLDDTIVAFALRYAGRKVPRGVLRTRHGQAIPANGSSARPPKPSWVIDPQEAVSLSDQWGRRHLV